MYWDIKNIAKIVQILNPIKEVTEFNAFDTTNLVRLTVISCENKIVCDQMFNYLEDYFKEEEDLNGRNR